LPKSKCHFLSKQGSNFVITTTKDTSFVKESIVRIDLIYCSMANTFYSLNSKNIPMVLQISALESQFEGSRGFGKNENFLAPS